jgi:hypothetical protein
VPHSGGHGFVKDCAIRLGCAGGLYVEETRVSGVDDFLLQCADASTVTASSDEWKLTIPITPPVISSEDSVVSHDFFASGPGVPADMFMWQEPAACGANPTQQSIVHSADAESVLKGVIPPNRTRIRIAATTTRAT